MKTMTNFNLGLDLKERAKEKAAEDGVSISGILGLGIRLYREGGLGEVMISEGPFPLIADKVSVTIDSKEYGWLRETTHNSSDVLRTIIQNYVDGKLEVALIPTGNGDANV